MEAYTSFAMVYDKFMDNIPYREWSEYIGILLKEYSIDNGLILDLGCGTGSLTALLQKQGYQMIGVDNSEEMLAIAQSKAAGEELDILYLLQDMREFELYGTVRAVISICDSINYITDSEDLREIFRLVNNYLDPGGIFIFDLNTCYKYEHILGDQTIAENREDCSFIWDNFYYEDEQINEYELNLFVKESADDDESLFRRYTETHYQKAYDLGEIKTLLTSAGLKYITAYDAFTHNPPSPDSERIYIIAQEISKTIKGE